MRPHVADELEAVELGHVSVCHDEVGGGGYEHRERLSAIGGGAYHIASTLEDRTLQLAHHQGVVHHHNVQLWWRPRCLVGSIDAGHDRGEAALDQRGDVEHQEDASVGFDARAAHGFEVAQPAGQAAHDHIALLHDRLDLERVRAV